MELEEILKKKPMSSNMGEKSIEAFAPKKLDLASIAQKMPKAGAQKELAKTLTDNSGIAIKPKDATFKNLEKVKEMAASTPDAQAKVDELSEKKSLSSQDKLYLALAAALPAVIGGAFGAEVGVAGAKTTQNILGGLQGQFASEEKDAKDQKDKLELAKLAATQKGEEQKLARDFQAQQKDADRDLRRDMQERDSSLKELIAGQKGGGLKLTKAEEGVDKAFSKTYNNFVAEGGADTINSNLKLLKDAKALLANTDSASGKFVGLLPKGARDVVVPQSGIVQDKIESAIQGSLRPILGGQFAAIEGKQIMERAFNPRLSEAENIQRLEDEINKLEMRVRNGAEAAQYYEDNGTLKGYKGASAVAGDYLKKPETQESDTVVVSDGKETLVIPVSDLEDAIKDGFKRVQ